MAEAADEGAAWQAERGWRGGGGGGGKLAFSMRKELRGIMPGGPYEAGLKRANKKVVKVTGGEGAVRGGGGATEGRRGRGEGGGRGRQGVRLPRAASSFSFAFTSSSSPSRPSTSPLDHLLPPP